MNEAIDEIRKRITLRPAIMPDDEPFLQDLYASTRDDLRNIISSESELRQLLLMQYNGQKAGFDVEFPNASHYIILLDGEPVGRLIIDRRPDVVFGVDMAILRPARNLGVGTGVLSAVLEECSTKGLSFRFSVVKTNPAMRLYHRLGCRIEGDRDTHFSMIWDKSKPE